MEEVYDFAIIGGGIVGTATFYKLQNRFPNLSIVGFEKEKSIGAHQTGHNSGVIHSGLYYKPGSLKAKNCVNGRRELVAFAKEHKVKHDVCGKVVVATTNEELDYLDKIFNIGLKNEIEGIEKINADQIKEIEPFVKGIAGINRAKYLIFCGGLQADRLAKKDGVKIQEKVVGFRGDYYELTEKGHHKVKHLIYPVPNPAFPFLGVHFTRMTNGEIECGPNAVFTFKREGYGKTDFETWKGWCKSSTAKSRW